VRLRLRLRLRPRPRLRLLRRPDGASASASATRARRGVAQIEQAFRGFAPPRYRARALRVHHTRRARVRGRVRQADEARQQLRARVLAALVVHSALQQRNLSRARADELEHGPGQGRGRGRGQQRRVCKVPPHSAAVVVVVLVVLVAAVGADARAARADSVHDAERARALLARRPAHASGRLPARALALALELKCGGGRTGGLGGGGVGYRASGRCLGRLARRSLHRYRALPQALGRVRARLDELAHAELRAAERADLRGQSGGEGERG
jgi:hypothetical protein